MAAGGNVLLRDLVGFLPGITGSVLQKDGKDLWVSPDNPSGRFSRAGFAIKDLALDADDSETEDRGDGITKPRLIPDATIIPGFMKIDGYTATADGPASIPCRGRDDSRL